MSRVGVARVARAGGGPRDMRWQPAGEAPRAIDFGWRCPYVMGLPGAWVPGPPSFEVWMLGALARRLFGSANDRFLKGFSAQVAAINQLEEELVALDDAALAA